MFSKNHPIAPENTVSNPMREPSLGDLVVRRLTRRAFLEGASVGAMTIGLGAISGAEAATALARLCKRAGPSMLVFEEVRHGMDQTHHVASGYKVQVLLRWGDPIMAGAPTFDPRNQTPQAQEKQFGFNNDFVGFLPLPKGSTNSDHGLLCVNHEYTTSSMMFDAETAAATRKRQVEVEMAAHGHSVVEIRRSDAGWQVVQNSSYNRRITALATPIALSGPAAGHEKLRTQGDPQGRTVIGTLNNCAGGKTPWGTVLLGEENFFKYFSGHAAPQVDQAFLARYLISENAGYDWYQYDPRFDVAKEPNESNRFGWIVELNPYDPQSVPVKRTALGRFFHEGANVTLNADGRAVCYMGDDQQFEYIYKFVSDASFDQDNPAAAATILDSGVLHVAHFSEDGTLAWLPLVYGEGKLTQENGFYSQADVLIDTRRAADFAGATPMDRPEDIEPNPVTGSVFVNLTNNASLTAPDVANPRAFNPSGHILEIIPAANEAGFADHAAPTGRWEIFLVGGDPAIPLEEAHYHPEVSPDGWLASPDNLAFDPQGRMWIATDGMNSLGIADGVYGTDTTGAGRALPRRFFACPRGAEACGPEFTPDGTTLFVAVQHPGEEAGSSFDRPSTRWPDFDAQMPPRPAVIAITKEKPPKNR